MNLKLLQVASLGAVTIGVSVFVLSPAFAEEGDAALATAVEKPSVPTMLRHTRPWSLPLRAEVTTSHGYAARPLRKASC
jgi:hypothetical protein